MKIAIIGAGAAGLGAAWMLRAHDITVYEAESYVGGGACTVDFPMPGGAKPIDMAVAITNPWLYPNLYALFQELAIDTDVWSISIGASFGPEQSWVTGLRGDFWDRMAPEAARFELEMFDVLNNPDPASPALLTPLREIAHKYSPEFFDKILFPVMSVYFVNTAGFLDLPLGYVATFIQETPLSSPLQYRSVRGGMAAFVAKLIAPFASSIRTNTPITSVTPGANGVVVTDASGASATYDHVVFATPANITSAILKQGEGDPTGGLLDAFTYQATTVYLHADEAYLSPALPPQTLCQYWYDGEDTGSTLHGVRTLRMGLIEGAPPALVTFFSSDTEARPPKDPVAVRSFEHLEVTSKSMLMTSQLSAIQGRNNLWYCGNYAALPYYEPCFVSGMVIATKLGATYPFANKALPNSMFQKVSGMMFPPADGTAGVAAHSITQARLRP